MKRINFGGAMPKKALLLATQLFAMLIITLITVVIILLYDNGKLPFSQTESKSEWEYIDGEESEYSEDYSEPEESSEDSGDRDTSKDISEEQSEEEVSKSFESSILGLKTYDEQEHSQLEVTDEIYAPGEDKNILLLRKTDELGELDGAIIQVRMGFVFITYADGTEEVFDGRYQRITEIVKDCDFAGVRDVDGNPLFSKDGNMYYLSDGELQESFYNPITDARGIEYDYPSWYGKKDSYYYVYYSDGYTGVRRSSDDGIIIYHSQKYLQCFSASEGYFCFTGKSGYLYFVNESSGNVLSGGVYPTPTERGIENLGYFYFDHGLTRVSVRAVDNEGNSYRKQALLHISGSLFTLPADFELVAYSEGMILLKKDGRYGYMNYLGEWITQPVYSYAEPFFEGLAVVADASGQYGIIDNRGEHITECVFDKITSCSGGLMLLHSQEKGYFLLAKTKITEQSE